MSKADDNGAGNVREAAAKRIQPAGVGTAGSAPVAQKVETVQPCLVLGYDESDGALAAAAWAAGDLVPDGRLVVVHATRSLHLPAMPIVSQRERRRLGHVLIDELLLEGPDSLADIEVQAVISDDAPSRASC